MNENVGLSPKLLDLVGKRITKNDNKYNNTNTK